MGKNRKRNKNKGLNKKQEPRPPVEKKMPGEIEETVIKIGTGECRQYLQWCYATGGYGDFKGKVDRIEHGKGVLFKYIDVEFFDSDDVIKGKEDHVWTFDAKKFTDKGVKCGDLVAFSGKVYAYKRMKDDTRDYAIKEFEDIRIINEYDLPSDDFLARQSAQRLVCDIMCIYNEHCYGSICIAPEGWKEKMVDSLLSDSQEANIP